jgi:hypothetical protein
MAIRGEVFSTAVQLPKRTYFFNVKENRTGDLYFNIVESKKEGEGKFTRQSVIVFDEDMDVFLEGFERALKVLRKEVVKKKTPHSPAGAARPAENTKKAYGKRNA